MHFGWRASWFLYFVSQWRRRIGFMNTAFATRINKDSDGALVVAARRGDARAFEALVLRHKQRVLAVAQRITNNREDAEDVAQESFHKAFLHLGSFQEKSRFSTWLTRIAMNKRSCCSVKGEEWSKSCPRTLTMAWSPVRRRS